MPAPTYFLSFLWRRGGDAVWHPVDAVSAEHPLDYIKRARLHANPDYEYRLLFFCEIPLDVYERHRPPSVE
jgi:hypothetical protein